MGYTTSFSIGSELGWERLVLAVSMLGMFTKAGEFGHSLCIAYLSFVTGMMMSDGRHRWEIHGGK